MSGSYDRLLSGNFEEISLFLGSAKQFMQFSAI